MALISVHSFWLLINVHWYIFYHTITYFSVRLLSFQYLKVRSLGKVTQALDSWTCENCKITSAIMRAADYEQHLIFSAWRVNVNIVFCWTKYSRFVRVGGRVTQARYVLRVTNTSVVISVSVTRGIKNSVCQRTKYLSVRNQAQNEGTELSKQALLLY